MKWYPDTVYTRIVSDSSIGTMLCTGIQFGDVYGDMLEEMWWEIIFG